MGLLKKLILLKLLDVKHCVLAIAWSGQKAGEPPDAADGLLADTLGQGSKGNCLDIDPYGAGLPCLFNPGLASEPQIKSGKSSRRVAQGLQLGDTGG